MLKNSRTKRETIAEKPAKSPKAFKEPNRLPVLSPKIPKESVFGINNRRVWNKSKTAEDAIIPNKTILDFFSSLKIIADMSIKRKAPNINQKVPTSSIVPKKETFKAGESNAESKNTKTTPKPESKILDRGRVIFPSERRAAVQKTIDTASPATKRNPFEVSIGSFVKGKKKIGNRAMTANNAQKEILSKIFDNIFLI